MWYQFSHPQWYNRHLQVEIDLGTVEFKDYDFGAWYMDATEDPSKYVGKKIKLRGMVYTNPHYPKGLFAIGS